MAGCQFLLISLLFLRSIGVAQEMPKEQGDFRKPDLVELVKLDPTIRLDIRYATSNNFLGRQVYKEARGFLLRYSGTPPRKRRNSSSPILDISFDQIKTQPLQ